jgi:hypothetical protein
MSSRLEAASMLANLRCLSLHFDTPDFHPFGQELEDCKQAAADTLNQALRELSRRLRRLDLTGRFLLSPDQFWPTSASLGSREAEKPLWPYLTHVKIHARLASPEGQFYINPELDPTGGARPHWTLNTTAVSDLVLRTSRGMLQMPRLECLTVGFPEFPKLWDDHHFIEYSRPNTASALEALRHRGMDLDDNGECNGDHKGLAPPWSVPGKFSFRRRPSTTGKSW